VGENPFKLSDFNRPVIVRFFVVIARVALVVGEKKRRRSFFLSGPATFGPPHHQQTICPCGVSSPAGPLAFVWQPSPKSQEKRQGGHAQAVAALPFNFATQGRSGGQIAKRAGGEVTLPKRQAGLGSQFVAFVARVARNDGGMCSCAPNELQGTIANRQPGHPYFRWHSAEVIFLATIRPPSVLSPSGST
jgi:hypothetical protein